VREARMKKGSAEMRSPLSVTTKVHSRFFS
jgi:hypothetical protein